MPTGYTAGIVDGKEDFEDFVRLCTRAFVFPIRELALDQPLPDEPFTADAGYYREALTKAEADLAEAEAWSLEDAQKAAQDAYDAEVEAEEKSKDRSAAIRERVEDALKKAHGWVPPTPEHEKFKEFMVEQLKITLEHDGTHTSYRKLEKDTGANFKAVRVQAAKDAIERHRKDIVEQEEKAKANWEWLKAVRESLGEEVAS